MNRNKYKEYEKVMGLKYYIYFLFLSAWVKFYNFFIWPFKYNMGFFTQFLYLTILSILLGLITELICIFIGRNFIL